MFGARKKSAMIPPRKAIRLLGRKPLIGKAGQSSTGMTVWRLAAPEPRAAKIQATQNLKKLHSLPGRVGRDMRNTFPIGGTPKVAPIGILPSPLAFGPRVIPVWIVSWPSTAAEAPKKGALKQAKYPKKGIARAKKGIARALTQRPLHMAAPAYLPGRPAYDAQSMTFEDDSGGFFDEDAEWADEAPDPRYEDAVQRLLADEFGRDPYAGYFGGCGCGR